LKNIEFRLLPADDAFELADAGLGLGQGRGRI
jgi:hypothetical protein